MKPAWPRGRSRSGEDFAGQVSQASLWLALTQAPHNRIGGEDAGGSRFVLMISHDTKQGEAGGRVIESIFFDTATTDITGSPWTQGRKLTAFVIECPLPN